MVCNPLVYRGYVKVVCVAGKYVHTVSFQDGEHLCRAFYILCFALKCVADWAVLGHEDMGVLFHVCQ